MPRRFLEYNYVGQRKQRNKLLELAQKKESSCQGRYYSSSDLRVGIVCDRFLFDSFFACCNLLYISPTDWKESIRKLDLFILVSTWSGLNDGDWVNLKNYPAQDLNDFSRFLLLMMKK